jgi:hypothetical protein
MLAHRVVSLRCNGTSAIGAKADSEGGASSADHDAIDPLPPSAIQSSCVAAFLFDQLVRAQQDRCRHIEAKRLGGLHIEHGLVFRSNFARSSAAISLAKA